MKKALAWQFAIMIFGAAVHAGPSQAQQPTGITRNSRDEVSAQPPNAPGMTLTTVIAEYKPGAFTPPHHHGQAFAMIYVLEGTIVNKVDDGKETVLHAGDHFTEAPNAHHVSVSQTPVRRRRHGSLRPFLRRALRPKGISPSLIQSETAAMNVKSTRRTIPTDTSWTVLLPYTPPFDWEGVLATFRAHQVPHLESVNDDAYERVVTTKRGTGWFRVEHEVERHSVRLSACNGSDEDQAFIAEAVRRMFDLDADPEALGQAMKADRHLSKSGSGIQACVSADRGMDLNRW